MFDHLQPHAVFCSSLRRVFPRISLIDVRQLDALTGNLLNCFGQFLHLRAVLFIGRRYLQGQQMAQRIHCRVNLRSLAALSSIVAATRARFRRRLQRAAVENHRRGLAVAPRKLAQKNAQILDHDLKTPRIDPSPHLLIDHGPRRQIVGQKAPLAACLGNVAKCVEYIAKRIVPLRSVFAAQRQIRGYKRPLLIGNIARIARPNTFFHASIVSQPNPNPLYKRKQRDKVNNRL